MEHWLWKWVVAEGPQGPMQELGWRLGEWRVLLLEAGDSETDVVYSQNNWPNCCLGHMEDRMNS